MKVNHKIFDLLKKKSNKNQEITKRSIQFIKEYRNELRKANLDLAYAEEIEDQYSLYRREAIRDQDQHHEKYYRRKEWHAHNDREDSEKHIEYLKDLLYIHRCGFLLSLTHDENWENQTERYLKYINEYEKQKKLDTTKRYLRDAYLAAGGIFPLDYARMDMIKEIERIYEIKTEEQEIIVDQAMSDFCSDTSIYKEFSI